MSDAVAKIDAMLATPSTGSRSDHFNRNSLLVLRAKYVAQHAALTTAAIDTIIVDAERNTRFQLVWVRPDPFHPAYLAHVPRTAAQAATDFDVPGQSAPASTGSQDLIRIAGWLADAGWTIAKFTLVDDDWQPVDAVRDRAYSDVLIHDLREGGFARATDTAHRELNRIAVAGIRANHGTATCEILRDGLMTTDAAAEVVATLNATGLPIANRRSPRTVPSPPARLTLWARLTRKATR